MLDFRQFCFAQACLLNNMSTTFSNSADEYLRYRELSMGAVASLVLGIISFTAILFVWLAVIPFMGFVLGYRAVKLSLIHI